MRLGVGGDFTTFPTAGNTAVFNDDAVDVNLVVKSDDNANMLFVDGGANRIGIGTGAPAGRLEVAQAQNTTNQFTGPHIALTADSVTDNTGFSGISYATSASDNHGFTVGALRAEGNGNPYFVFNSHSNSASGTEVMRLTAANDLLVGHTSRDSPVDNGGAGVTLMGAGVILVGRAGTAIFVNREDGDGTMMEFRKDGASIGNISILGGNNLTIGGTVADHCGLSFATNAILPVTEMATNNDTVDLGANGNRFKQIFATNGTINTSDETLKQDIAGLTSTEMLVAKRLSVLFKTFRWKSRVATEGDDARTHTGIIAQDVQAAFSAEGLDAGNYSLFTSGSWWEHDVDVDAVEANEDTGDKAVEAHTRTDHYYIESEAPEGSTKKTTLGIRYNELLSFLAAYNEQRFAAIETRLTALEG
tara:strand:- start:184 stop:1437 length:1254 start_codon:yes stop_codon:yes gene_type:complete